MTIAELKRRGITRYDAEMLLSQGFCLPEPKIAVGSPLCSKSRLIKSSMPVRFSPRNQSKALPSSIKSNRSTPTSAGALRKSVEKRKGFVRQNQKHMVSRPRRGRMVGHQSGGSSARVRNTRQMVKQAVKHVDLDRIDFGDDEDDSSSESSSGSSEYFGRKVNVDVPLSMSCEAIDSSNPWMARGRVDSPVRAENVLTPTKLRTRPRHLPTTALSADDMPLLKKESTVSDVTSTPSLVSQTKLKSSSDQARGDDMPVLEKEQEEELSAFGPDSSVDSGWTSSADRPQPPSSLAHRCRRHLDVADRRFGYDTREWRVPKLTIRRRRASGQSVGNSSGLVSSTSLPSSGLLIYEILPSCGHGSVESQPPSDDSSYSDQKSTTMTSSPDSISPSCFYSGGTAGGALKRLRLKFGEESVAIDVGRG